MKNKVSLAEIVFREWSQLRLGNGVKEIYLQRLTVSDLVLLIDMIRTTKSIFNKAKEKYAESSE